jgi:hypothetical protein
LNYCHTIGINQSAIICENNDCICRIFRKAWLNC